MSFPHSQGKITLNPQREGYGSYRSASLIVSAGVFLPLNTWVCPCFTLSSAPVIISTSETILIDTEIVHYHITWVNASSLRVQVSSVKILCLIIFCFCRWEEEQTDTRCSDLEGTGCYWETWCLTLNTESTFKERYYSRIVFSEHTKWSRTEKKDSECWFYCRLSLLICLYGQIDKWHMSSSSPHRVPHTVWR